MTIAVFAFSGAFIAGTPAAAQDQPSTTTTSTMNVTGDWKIQVTGNRFISGDLHLSQVGDTIVGSGLSAAGSGEVQISGKLTGSTVSGKWRGPTGETGWITLNFQNDSTFSGEWGYGGRGPNGHIVAQKARSSSF